MAKQLDKCKVYLANLHFALRGQTLEEVLLERGVPISRRVYMRNTAAAPLGKAFVTFASEAEALICKLAMNGLTEPRIAPGPWPVEATSNTYRENH